MLRDSPAIPVCDEVLEEESGHSWQPGKFLPEAEPWRKTEKWADNWEQIAPGLLRDFTAEVLAGWLEVARLDVLDREVLLLKDRVAELERSAPACVMIETFAPEPYKVVKPFHVVVQARHDEYVASFFDANLSASGTTEAEAIFNLKDVIVAVFESLAEHHENKLGPGPARQLHVLREFVERTT